MTDETPITGGVQFRGIDVLNYHIEPALPSDEAPSVGFMINVLHRLDQEQELVQVELDINLENADTRQQLGNLKTCCTFATRNVMIVNPETQEINSAQTFIDMMNSLSLSTARGILYTHFAKTYLHPVVLPIIDPKIFQPNAENSMPA